MIVTLDQLKQNLRIQHDDEDDLLISLLIQAQAATEDFCLTTFDDDNAPHPVRLAVILMASHYYEYREASDRFAIRAMRMAFESLLWPHRDVSKLI